MSDNTNEPKTVRVRLQTIDDVKHELGRIYRLARRGVMETQDLSRYANVLQILGRLIEGSDLEARLAKLEEAKP